MKITKLPIGSKQGQHRSCLISFSTVLLISFMLFLMLASSSVAQEFSAKTIGDYGNVTVMEVRGNYDALTPDGSTVNSVPRQEIAKEFFRVHKDEYDFLVIFTNFDFKMPEGDTRAFYLRVRNDTQGIGLEFPFDNSVLFGSNGKLQGTIDMGNVDGLAIIPVESGFEETLDTLAHETMHRWGAYVKFKDALGNVSDALLHLDLTKYAAHWSFLLNSYGSVLYGNDWQDNGNGTFTSVGIRKYYSPLDLYLMGFYDKSQIPPMLLIDNAEIPRERLPELGVTITGTPQYVTIDDIIAAEGERVPSSADSQKTFKTAFIFITTPGTFEENEISQFYLQGMENIRSGWMTRFSILTDGQGMMQIESIPKEEVPTNPGIVLPPIVPRPLPPSIDDGVAWLMNHQQSNGSWRDSLQTAMRDTAETLLSLKNFAIAGQNYSSGLQWLGAADSRNMVYLSKSIEALADAGSDVSALLSVLLSAQNADGGWGSNRFYRSNPVDTSFAMRALAHAGYSGVAVLSKAIDYLKSGQNTDGGWGSEGGGSSIEVTTNVLNAFNKYRKDFQVEDQILNGKAWLAARQNADGGFGASPSTVYETAMALSILTELNVLPEKRSDALNYILGLQSEDGSWYESPYQTAIAVKTVWKATIDPDLSIKGTDIVFTPPAVISLPAGVDIQATIRNLGRTSVPEAKVALYDGNPSLGRKLGEQTLAFPGQVSTTVTFHVTITDGNAHQFYIWVDPDNLIEESNKSNNIALNILAPESTYDFETLPSGVSASPNPVDIFHDVKIAATITNKGTLNAYNVQVRYYIDDPGAPFEIATATADLPANSTVKNEITWRASRAGVNLPVTVLVDPFNLFTELSKTNNKVSTGLTVTGSTEPNLTVRYQDIGISPSPALEGESATISALIKNEGFSTANNIVVNFFKGDPGVDGVLLGSQTISSLDAGKGSTVSVTWSNISESGERIIYVRVDPDNQIAEIREDDNDAFVTLKILSLPDLAVSTGSIIFTPPAPKEGDPVQIGVTVENKGEQGASSIMVRVSEGATVIGSDIIPSIGGNSFGVISFPYDTTGKKGPHEITAVVDPSSTIAEQRKDNNTASRTFGVQDANLWVTEQYISPNGDGIKDSTQFFFRLAAPQTVTVAVFNEKGESVRTFSGADFVNASAGNVTWNGLDDEGRIVDDGTYRITILDVRGNSIDSLPLIVDNNRSPIASALGTDFLLDSVLCNGNTSDYCGAEGSWLPDESGILLTGVGTTIGLDGEVTQIPTGGGFVFSPALDRAVYSSRLWNSSTGRYDAKLWGVDRDGRNLKEFDSFSGYYAEYYPLEWSPGGAYFAYRTFDGEAYLGVGWVWYRHDLYIIKPEGTGKMLVESGYSGSSQKWSPDGSRIAYYLSTKNDAGRFDCAVKVSDTSGNKGVLFEYLDQPSIQVDRLEWLSNNRLLLVSDNKFIVLDADGIGEPLTIFEPADSIVIQRLEVLADQKILLFYVQYGMDYGYKLQLLDSSGSGIHSMLYESDRWRMIDIFISKNRNSFAFKPTDNYYYENETYEPVGYVYVYAGGEGHIHTAPPRQGIGGGVWSSDGNRLAFAEGAAECLDWRKDEGYWCAQWSGTTNIVLMDARTREETVVPLSVPIAYTDVGSLAAWLYDGVSILSYNEKIYRWDEPVLSIIDSRTGEIKTIASDVTFSTDSILSPSGNYLAFSKNVGSGEYVYEIHAMRSLLNLTALLTVTRDRDAILLRGTAQDLNFEGFKLEYADAKTPTQWIPIGPPSNVPVVNEVFTTWVPPYEGSFYVKLTVWDRAGNAAWDRKRVSWGSFSSITNLYKTQEIFSPNGDGIKDTVELHYRVLDPVHLIFYIYDEKDNLIKTFLKDYASPGEGFITWDGTDELSRVVADGKYTIKVFDYEFFVEVDNTPPDVDLGLSEIKQYTGRKLYVDLSGHAVDDHLKSWIVEYGEGDNPQEWHELIRGTDRLVKRDNNGNPILDPVQDDLIGEFVEDRIEAYLVEKKFRITAEDFAGNKSTRIGDFLSEAIVFDKWEKEYFDIEEGLITNTYGLATLGVRETIREPIAKMTVQYSRDGGTTWVDAQSITNPPSGFIEIQWDTSQLDPPDFPYKVRVKAFDVIGNEYDSNVATMNGFYLMVSCAGISAFNAIEDLVLLKFQIRSDQDPEYGAWKDVGVYDSAKTHIPTGGFSLLLDPDLLKPGRTYLIRMVGTGENGGSYESNTGFLPPSLCPAFEIDVEYEEAQSCDQMAPGKATLIAYMKGIESPEVTQRTLTYLIQKPVSGFELLKTIDLTDLSNAHIVFRHNGEPYWELKTTTDINTLPERKYPIKGVLEIETLKDKVKAEATGELIVDRVLPIARITYPGESLLICPVTVSGPQGDKYVVRIEGKATDENGVKRYELYYGDTKTSFSGKGAKEGNLGSWDVTGLQDQAPLITLRVTDIAGNVSCDTTSFSLNNVVEIASLTADKFLFSPNGDGVLDDVTVTYVIAESAQVDVKVFKANKSDSGSYTLDSTPVRTIVSDRVHPGGSGTVTWDGKNDGGIVVPGEKYGIVVFATDACKENTTQKFVVVAVGNTTTDTTPPDVVLYTPKDGDVYGNTRSPVSITGAIIEENLDQYALRYGAGEAPGSWTVLKTGTTLPLPSPLVAWDVGKAGGIADGLYTVSLYAKDKSNLEGEAKVRITIDNTPPDVSITSPSAGGYVTGPMDTRGTASDPNLDNYTLEFSQGECAAAFKWATIAVGRTSVREGILAPWKSIPADGDYCIRLTAIDKLSNKAEAKVNIKIDTHPPAVPVLSGRVENKSDASLSWTSNTEPDIKGYNLYRNNQKVNSGPLGDTSYPDQGLKDGSYTYTVKAVDLAGLESGPSNEVKVKIDLTPPDAKISSPLDGARVSGRVSIKGTAFSSDDFKQYRVYIGVGVNPSVWNLIRTSPVPVSYGPLTDWDTLGLADGIYSIKLEAEDIPGNINVQQVVVNVDNIPPAAPVLISATPTGSDVAVTWQANAEADLAGYLLYRNDQLANSTGIAIGDLKGYLISGITYLDKALPDGKFKYYLVAMDRAGNTSDPSNALEATIDTRPPKATIVDPADKSKFDKKTLIKAESPDIDVASIQFQYKKALDSTWINLNSPVLKTPYITYFDPTALGLTYGDYTVRAVATDNGAKTDPSPVFITLIYTDLTPPTAPTGLKALVNGKAVTLTWTANTEADLDGYNIYRTLGSTKTKVNASIVKAVTYGDTNLSDGMYTYEITAVDTFSNESNPSTGVSARVYAPLVSQPITPTGQRTISVHGTNAEPNSTVEISIEGGSVSPVTVRSDLMGRFSFDANLTPGENRITAKATDSLGNISRTSDMVVVVYDEPPSAPTGLKASVEGSNVKLTWNPNPETDLAGYNVYRDGRRLNLSGAITSGAISASSSYSSDPPSNAFDGDPSTYWMSDYSSPTFTPVWWEIDLPSPELINHVEIDWATTTDGQGNEVLIAGKDYEIQVWSGAVWIPLTEITGNGSKKNVFDFTPSYRTDMIRVYITATTDPSGSNYVGMSEIKILKDNLVTETSYDDLGLPNGTYAYVVTAVDLIGSESLPSNGASAVVHIAPPVSPINLKVSSLPEGAALRSIWEYGGVPAGGYNLYRSTTSGGPYVKPNASLITEKSYVDNGLTNGVAYFYVVVAVDSLGNESLYSNEAMGIPLDSAAPAKPVIFYPTLLGIPLTVYDGIMDLSGSAEPGSTVELFKGGVSIGTTTATSTDLVQTFPLDSSPSGASISPDGKTLAYLVYDNNSGSSSIWLMQTSGAGSTQIIPQGDTPVWSPDGRKLAYTSSSRISLYDTGTHTASLLTGDVSVSEGSPSWSSDGTKIAFISNRGGFYDVWIKDIPSGILSQVTNQKSSPSAKLSPDGKKVAYFEGQGLYVVDLLGETLTVDLTTDSTSLDWSPDGKRLAFISSKNGNGNYDIFVLDLETQNQTQLTHSPQGTSNISWSPDGQKIVFSQWETDWTISIKVTSPTTPGQETGLKDNLSSLIYLAWAKSGGIAYVDQTEWKMVYRKGYFRFDAVDLDPGENRFYATSTDSSGNVSDPSDEILLLFDTGLLPDLEITTDDVFVYPPYPISGEDVLISVDVRNKGGVEARDVNVDIYLGHPDGELEILASRTIPSIASSSGESISVIWNSAGKTGRYTVIAVADPMDEIEEVSNSNNVASREFIVLEREGVFMTASLDSDQYRSHRDVGIELRLMNSGQARDVILEVWIEDQNGDAVTLVSAATMALPYGSDQKVSLAWNTGSNYAGPYRVHPILKDTSGVLAETLVPFTILPDMDVVPTVVTDKAHYGANEEVIITAKVKNDGTNYIIPNLSAKVRILDGSGIELFSQDKAILNLFPGITMAFSSTWRTGLNPPGNYSAIIEIYLDGNLTSNSAVALKIDADSIISGYIIATPPIVIVGNQVHLDYAVRNDGNADLNGFLLKVSVTDPVTQDIMNSHEETIDLRVATPWSGGFSFSTEGYGLKTYSVVLQGNPTDIASTAITVIDATPPTVSVISPKPNSYANAVVAIVAIASDDASGVDTVEYQIDGNGWNPLPTSDAAVGKYAAVWTPGDSDKGAHRISIRATDKAGNTSIPVETKVTVDLTLLPPVANAGEDQNVLTGQVVTLDGSGSYDPQGSAITFRWRFIEVPQRSTVTDASLSDAVSAKPTFTPDKDGTYWLQLIVNDGVFDSKPDFVAIIASTPGVPPNANAGPDQNVATGVEVSLDGSESYDPDGQPLTFQWSLESKPSASALTNADVEGKTTPNPSFTPDVEGAYRFRLVVNDGLTDSPPDYVEVHAFPVTGNIPPNARAGKNQHAKVGTLVVLDGSASFDPDDGPADLMTFQWTFKAVPSGSALLGKPLIDGDQVSPSFLPDVPGAYTVELQVNDGLDTDTDEVTIQTYSTNVPPNARAGQDRKVGPGEEVNLDGTMSFDPDEGPGPLTYGWRFVFLPQRSTLTNGSIVNTHTATPKFTPDVVGTYVVELTVSDGLDTDYDHVMVIATIKPWVEVTVTEGTVGTEFTLKGHNCEFGSAKGKLFMGKRALKAVSWASQSIFIRVTKPNPPATYDVKILPKKPKGGTQQTIWEPRCFTVKVPEVDRVTFISAVEGYRVTGKFFGTKKGKIYLGDLACKVKTWSMNPATNESEATFLLPKGVTTGTFMLNVANKVGRGKKKVTLP